MQIAISVQNLSKRYRLYKSHVERFKEMLHPLKKKYHKEFWALRDINFDVMNGSTLGIIGRNGSGKSTLLQIICGVSKATVGAVTVNGRISALLELGAGFNPDLTGRQNAILNGVVNGLSKDEMKERIPLIKEFADIGEFFDQPVKIYSSGMFVRLAFAAAINVDPDILIVDEALAVGDAKFQRKCYNKFLEFQNQGKTILFVTHDIHAIIKHCDCAILLENGCVRETGLPKDVVLMYEKLSVIDNGCPCEFEITESDESNVKGLNGDVVTDISEFEYFFQSIHVFDRCVKRKSYNKNEFRFGSKQSEIIDYLITSGGEYDPTTIKADNSVDMYIKVKASRDIKMPTYGLTISTKDGILLYGTNTVIDNKILQSLSAGDMVIYHVSLRMDLNNGDYFISHGVGEISDGAIITSDARNDLIHLQVFQKKPFLGIVPLMNNFKEIRI
ncbi:MAG: ABC transporter ATP-binding protein [Nitrospirae bacterium]|nr:ABC transporter ATP-binding protein [Nitrospirota bacterium]